jgi:hypothetical protein
MEDVVTEALRTQFLVGDLSEEAVSARLSMGRRKLQRVLKAEGTSFRNVRERFLETRAGTSRRTQPHHPGNRTFSRLLRGQQLPPCIPAMDGALSERVSYQTLIRNRLAVFPRDLLSS